MLPMRRAFRLARKGTTCRLQKEAGQTAVSETVCLQTVIINLQSHSVNTALSRMTGRGEMTGMCGAT